mgnify:CR=1 FL=1
MIILITFLIGLGLGYQMNNQLVWKNVQHKAAQLPLRPDIRGEIKNLTGEIVKIDNNVIELKTDPLAMGLLIPQDYLTKQIKLTKTTKIFQRIKKSDEEYNAEITEQQKQGQAQPQELLPIGPNMGLPMTISRYKTVDLTIDDLSVGRQIQVRVNEDAKTVNKLTAVEIILMAN